MNPRPFVTPCEEGYTDCACRDCFEIAIGKPGEAVCSDCEEAGCPLGENECLSPDAYGGDLDLSETEMKRLEELNENPPAPSGALKDGWGK